MKTPRRNKSAMIAFFLVLGPFGGGPLMSLWLAQSFDLSDWAVALIALLWGFVVGTVAIFGYYELEDVAADRRMKADEARLQARWEELRRGLL